MANYFSKKIALMAAGATLSFATINANQAQAALVTYNFSFTFPEGFTETLPIPITETLAGEVATGSFAFDDTGINQSSPLQFFEINGDNPDEGEFFTLNIGESIFDETDGLSPTAVSFLNGNFTGIVFEIDPGGFTDDEGNTVLPLTSLALLGTSYAATDVDFNFAEGPIAYQQVAPTSVPEPGTVGGLMVLGLGWLLKKQKALTSHHAELTD